VGGAGLVEFVLRRKGYEILEIANINNPIREFFKWEEYNGN
jgi:hypothetical protein